MPQSSLSGVSNFSSNILKSEISTASNVLIDKIKEKESDINIKLQSRQKNIKFDSGITLTNYNHPTIIEDGITKEPILYGDNKYMYIFSNVTSNSSIHFPQDTLASVLIVGGGGAGAPDIGGGGAGGNIVIGENINIPANFTFPVIVGAGGRGSLVEDGSDSVAFGTIAKGGDAGKSVIIASDGTIQDGGYGGNVSNVILNNDIFKQGKYVTGITNSIKRDPAAIEFTFYNDTTDMYLWYKFDVDDDIMLLDSSGNGHHITSNVGNTCSKEESRTGNGCLRNLRQSPFEFNQYSITENVNIGDTDGTTISFWFKINALINASYDLNAGGNYLFQYLSTNGISLRLKVHYGVWSGFEQIRNLYIYNSKNFKSLFKVDTGVWYHVAFKFVKNQDNTTSLYVYKNGILEYSFPTYEYPLNYAGNTGRIIFSELNGLLDDCRIYTRALQDDEINIIYELAGKQPVKYEIVDNLLLRYKFEKNNFLKNSGSLGDDLDLLELDGEYVMQNNSKYGKSSLDSKKLVFTIGSELYSKNSLITDGLIDTAVTITFWILTHRRYNTTGTLFSAVKNYYTGRYTEDPLFIILGYSWQRIKAFGLYDIYTTALDIYGRTWIDITPNTGVWYHYSLVFRRNDAGKANLIVYRDGIEIWNYISTADFKGNYRMDKIKVGNFFGSYLDDFCMFNRELSVDEIIGLAQNIEVSSSTIKKYEDNTPFLEKTNDALLQYSFHNNNEDQKILNKVQLKYNLTLKNSPYSINNSNIVKASEHVVQKNNFEFMNIQYLEGDYDSKLNTSNISYSFVMKMTSNFDILGNIIYTTKGLENDALSGFEIKGYYSNNDNKIDFTTYNKFTGEESNISTSTIHNIELDTWHRINANFNAINDNTTELYVYKNNNLILEKEEHNIIEDYNNNIFRIGCDIDNQEMEYVEFKINVGKITFSENTLCDILLVGGGGAGKTAAGGGGNAGECIYLKDQLFMQGSYDVIVGNGGVSSYQNGGDTFIVLSNTTNYIYKASGGKNTANNYSGGDGIGSVGKPEIRIRGWQPWESLYYSGDGGNGIIMNITGSDRGFCAGGGGGGSTSRTSYYGKGGGVYIDDIFVKLGGDAQYQSSLISGLPNTGSGGGGGYTTIGEGGSGIVIIRWKKTNISQIPIVEGANVLSYISNNEKGLITRGFLLNDFRVYSKTLTLDDIHDYNTSPFYNDTSDMIAWYEFDNSFMDSSDNNYMLYVSSNYVTEAKTYFKEGGGYEFDYFDTNTFKRGIASFCITGYDSSPPINENFYNLGKDDSISFCSWFTIYNYRAGQVLFSAKPSNTLNESDMIYFYVHSQINNGITIRIYNNNVLTQYSTNQIVSLHTWYHLCIVFIKSDKVLKIYINSVLISTVSNFNYPSNKGDYLIRIGKSLMHMQQGGTEFHGRVDDFRIYNRELSIEELQHIYSFNDSPYSFVDDNLNMPIRYKFDYKDFLKNFGNSGSTHDLLSIGVSNKMSINDSVVINGTACISSINNEYVQMLNDWDFTYYEACSICFWLRKTTLNNAGSDNILNDVSNQGEVHLKLARWENDSTWSVIFAGGVWNVGVLNDWVESDLNIWHNYVFKFTKTDIGGIIRPRLTIYKDNTHEFDEIDMNAIWTPTIAIQPRFFSENNTNFANYFYGYLDDFRIYNKDLQLPEIEHLYKSRKINASNGGGSKSIIYYASGGAGAGSSSTIVNDVSYGDGGQGIQSSVITVQTYGQGGGGGSTSSYGYAGGKGTGKNNNVLKKDALPNTGAGGGGGQANAVGGSGGSGLVAVLWTKADSMQISQEADHNMSNYVSEINSQLKNSIITTSNELSSVLHTEITNINNYLGVTTDYMNSRLNNLSTDTISTEGTSNQFIVNNIWNNDIVISGTLYASNLSIVGSNILVYTDAYTTENVSILTEAHERDGLNITHTGEGTHNVLTTTIAGNPALVITKDGYVGIGKTNPTCPLDIVGDVKVTGNILPTSTEAYDLGSPEYKWRDLYLSGNSIYLGDNTVITTDVDTGGISIKDGIGNLKEISASSYKIKDPETSQIFSMKLGADKKIKFVSIDESNPNAIEEEVGTAADVWSSNNGYISYGNVKVYDTTSSISMSVGENVKIYDDSITIVKNSVEHKLITESSTSLISFYGKDAVVQEVTNNILDITNVPYKKSGRNSDIYYRVFDISIISELNNLLFSGTLFRTYTINDPSLIAWYKFDGDVLDSSGNNNSIISAESLIIHKNDIYNRNNSGYIGLNNLFKSASVVSGNEITISFWFKSPSNFNAANRLIYSIKDSIQNSSVFKFERNNNVGDVNLSFSYFANYKQPGGTVPMYKANTWYHLTTVIKKNNINGIDMAYIIVYGNGVSRVVSNNEWEWQDINGYFDIDNTSFTKHIDDLRIYRRALSEDEILAIYNGTKSNNIYADGLEKQLKFSYYTTNTVVSSHNGDGYLFNDNDIWFETINDIEYIKSSLTNNSTISITSR